MDLPPPHPGGGVSVEANVTYVSLCGHAQPLGLMLDSVKRLQSRLQILLKSKRPRSRIIQKMHLMRSWGENGLQDCLDCFTAVETLQARDGYRCEHCDKQQDVRKQLLIARCPSILVLQLKRFSAVGALAGLGLPVKANSTLPTPSHSETSYSGSTF